MAELLRGQIWTASGGSDYAGKPGPVLIVQADGFSELNSVTICGFTSNETDADLLRITIEPTIDNGLQRECRLMIDKTTTIQRSKLGQQIGTLSDADMTRVNRAIAVFLGLAGS